MPVAMTKQALTSGAFLVIAEKRPVFAICETPATTTMPMPTKVMARPRLKQSTATTPKAACPRESARSITVMEAGQGIIPPAAPKAIT